MDEKRKINRLTIGRSLRVPVNAESVLISIEEDRDHDRYWNGPVKIRCEAPNGLKAGSVVGMLRQLGLSADEILALREEGTLSPEDFLNIGAPWEPFDPDLCYRHQPKPPAEAPAKAALVELSQPLEQALAELANIDQVPPEKTLEVAERVQRRLEWEMLKEQSREEIAWLLENLEKANTARRCAHIKPDGSNCRAPALKAQDFCHWHSETRAFRRATKESSEIEMPVLEDRVGIQLGIMRVCDLLTGKAIDPYTARVLFQGLRLAERTLNKENFLPPSPDLWKAAERAGRKDPREED